VRTPSSARRLALGACFVALAACSAAGAPNRRAAGDAASCDGQPYVEVRNELATPVDVYGYVGASRTYLGTVSTGVRRIPLFQPTAYFVAMRDGRRVDRRHGVSRVVFTRGCDRG